MLVGLQSALPVGVTAALREEKKTTRPTNVHQLNEISITLQGQQTVQEIVSKATHLFRCLQDTSMVVDEKSKQEARNNNKKVQDTLNGLKELFSRLRVFYDESNRRIEIPHGEDLEVCYFRIWNIFRICFRIWSRKRQQILAKQHYISKVQNTPQLIIRLPLLLPLSCSRQN